MKADSAIIRRNTFLRGIVWTLMVLACGLFNTGCVTGRRSVALAIPAMAANGSAKGDIAVVSVVDSRQFQNKPANPSTPSVDGDVTSLSAEQRATFIGRQRNGYGKAMGDIALPPGDSVLLRTKTLVEEGLKRHGYTIAKDDKNPAHAVSVDISEFWAWFSPGMWSVGFDARINATLTFRQGDKSQSISVHGVGNNQGQVASDENWQLAYQRAFADFLVHLEQALDKAAL